MKTLGQVAFSAACALLLLGASLTPSAAADDYVAPVPEIGALPTTVTGVGTYSAHVTVTYKCRNDDRTVNYLLVEYKQPSPDDSSQLFSRGSRQSRLPLLAATCTGDWVQERVQLPISPVDWIPLPLARTTGLLSFTVQPRGGPATPGGWYVEKGPFVTKTAQGQAIGSRLRALPVGARVGR